MFCPNCGKEIQQSAKFCSHCGHAVKTVSENPPQPETAQEQKAQPETGERSNPPEQPGRRTEQAEQQAEQADQQPEQQAEQADQQPERQAAQQTYEQAAASQAQAAVLPVPTVTVPASPTRPVSKARRILAAVTVIAVIGGVVLYNNAKTSATPEKVALQYFSDMTGGKWSSVYDELAITPGKFTGKDSFVQIMKRDVSSLPSVENYEAASGQSGQTKNGLSRNVTISYTLSGQSAVKTVSVKLIKQSSKKWLFFDNWKVSSDSLVADGYTISAPAEAELYLDGVRVDNSDVKAAGSASGSSGSGSSSGSSLSSSSGNLSKYTLPELFVGSHTLKVASPFTKDFSKTIEVDSGEAYTVSGLELSDSAVKDLTAKSEQAIKGLYAAAVAGKKFSEVTQYFAPKVIADGTAEKQYNYLADDVTGSYYATVKQLDLSNVAVVNAKVAQDGTVSAGVTFSYTYTVSVTDWYYGKVTDYSSSAAKKSGATCTFTYSGGKWLLNTISTQYLSLSTY